MGKLQLGGVERKADFLSTSMVDQIRFNLRAVGTIHQALRGVCKYRDYPPPIMSNSTMPTDAPPFFEGRPPVLIVPIAV